MISLALLVAVIFAFRVSFWPDFSDPATIQNFVLGVMSSVFAAFLVALAALAWRLITLALATTKEKVVTAGELPRRVKDHAEEDGANLALTTIEYRLRKTLDNLNPAPVVQSSDRLDGGDVIPNEEDRNV